MKNIKLIKINVCDYLKLLLDLDQKIYRHSLVTPFKNIKEIKKHLGQSIAYLIYENNKVIGYSSYDVQNNKIHVSGIALLGKFRGKGIGTYIMKKLLNQLKTYKNISLTVHPKNAPAVKMYYNLGFVATGWKDNFFGDGQPRLILEKNNP